MILTPFISQYTIPLNFIWKFSSKYFGGVPVENFKQLRATSNFLLINDDSNRLNPIENRIHHSDVNIKARKPTNRTLNTNRKFIKVF